MYRQILGDQVRVVDLVLIDHPSTPHLVEKAKDAFELPLVAEPPATGRGFVCGRRRGVSRINCTNLLGWHNSVAVRVTSSPSRVPTFLVDNRWKSLRQHRCGGRQESKSRILFPV